MALDITALDIVIDESTGKTDNDVADLTVAPHSTVNDPLLDYLLGLDSAGGLASPEVAYMENFITASATGGDSFSSVSLASTIGGAAFSITTGVNSGIRTVDGKYVWLFLDPNNANIVQGVVGTTSVKK